MVLHSEDIYYAPILNTRCPQDVLCILVYLGRLIYTYLSTYANNHDIPVGIHLLFWYFKIEFLVMIILLIKKSYKWRLL